VSANDIAIDTLAFSDLVKIGLEDIPGASQREWTLHGAVDPGITILELLAWQFEQRLFMAEQLTEPIIRASLRLLGLADPAPARPAVTVLGVRAPGAANPLPAGTVFGLERDADGRSFATDADVSVAPVSAVQASGRLLEAGDALELVLGIEGAAAPASELSLLVEVDAAPGVEPAWHPDAVDVEPPALLRWEAVGPGGTASAVQVADTTGALRRSGLLALAWPAVWDEPGTEAPRLRAIATAASYTEPVRVVAVGPNAVIARHRVPASADVSDQLRGFLALPGQLVRLPGAAGQLLDEDGDVVLTVTERDGARHDWTAVRSWVGVGPADRVVRVDRDRGELRFGDGRAGRILRPAEAPDAEVRFALGGGANGNLGALGGWAQDGGAAVAVNPVAADGGAEPESLESARQRSADALTTRDRTVTEVDARVLAVTTPGLGLARAHVTPGLHPGFPCDPMPGALAVTIVPHADRRGDSRAWTPAPQPDAGAIATTRTRLERARLLGQEIFVLAPVYRRVAVDLGVSATAQAGDARERIMDALRRHLDPLVGGSERGGWPFGGAVRPSALAGVVQRALGPEATVTRLAVALDGGPWSDCADAEIGSRELVWLESATVSWVTALPTGGGLR
jgi:predicted phage baseplate assembly protein